MNKISFIDSIRNKYIDEHLESSKKLNYKDLTEKDGLIKVAYKDLPNTEINGYPIASEYISSDGKSYSTDEIESLDDKTIQTCELVYYFLPYSHEIYIGSTGSGKTTGCVEPQLRAISSQKNKPNLFVTDPKGELFDRNAKHLKDQGYEVFMLNFKNLIRSNRWNPLLEFYEEKIKLKELGKSCKMRTGKVKSDLKLICDIQEFCNDSYIEYKGYAFPDGAKCDKYIAFERDYLEANIDSLINQFANMIIEPKSKTDLSWEFGAQDLLKGILHCMLEDAVDETSGFTKEMMTFKTIQEYYLALKLPIIADSENLATHWLLKNKSTKAKALMSSALGNASNTMRSYCGVFDGATKDWFQGHIFALTTGNTINIDNIGDKPFAIFIITRDYDKSDSKVAGIFIDWVYRKMIERAEKTKKPRAFHFLLEEFGNIPEIKDFENKISTSRSRNIWFHLVVQSYMQINLVYGANRSVIIRDNCNAQIFLGAQNWETKEIFSGECGKHFIPTLGSRLDMQDNNIQSVPIIPVSALDLIIPGQMYIKRIYMPVITSQFVRSYICARHGIIKNSFGDDGLNKYTPYEIEPFNAPKYTFQNLKKPKPKKTFSDFDF